jgi:hypothetical protein
MTKKNNNDKLCSDIKSYKIPKNIKYYIDYTAPPIAPNDFVKYSSSTISETQFIAFKYRRDILDYNNNVIGNAFYDVKCNEIKYDNNNTSGLINATYTSVQSFIYKNKNYVVYVQGKINYTLVGSPIDTDNPFLSVVSAEIQNLATTNVFINSSIYTNVQVKTSLVNNSLITKYTLKFDNAVKTI